MRRWTTNRRSTTMRKPVTARRIIGLIRRVWVTTGSLLLLGMPVYAWWTYAARLPAGAMASDADVVVQQGETLRFTPRGPAQGRRAWCGSRVAWSRPRRTRRSDMPSPRVAMPSSSMGCRGGARRFRRIGRVRTPTCGACSRRGRRHGGCWVAIRRGPPSWWRLPRGRRRPCGARSSPARRIHVTSTCRARRSPSPRSSRPKMASRRWTCPNHAAGCSRPTWRGTASRAAITPSSGGTALSSATARRASRGLDSRIRSSTRCWQLLRRVQAMP